jgi:hypothetical protein
MYRIYLTLYLLFSLFCSKIFPEDINLIILNRDSIIKIKSEISKGNKKYDLSLKALNSYSEKLLKEEIKTVVEKKEIPTSGDRHDYMSLSIYAWPDPDKENGLPYIIRDGEVNPEIYDIKDKQNFESMPNKILNLALSYFYTDNNLYAEKAVQFLKTWFINEDTKMNPNLNYAQGVKGKNNGQSGGIIDSTGMILLTDAIKLLDTYNGYDAKTRAGVNAWLSDYLKWLTESVNGKKESEAVNNHGTWYDAQTASISLLLNKKEAAVRIIKNAFEKRMPDQFEPNGMQPYELKRTKGLSYSIYNLRPWFYLASIAGNLGMDYWHYESKDSKSIKKALDYLIPYLSKEKEFELKQITEIKAGDFLSLLIQASIAYNDPKYLDVIKKYLKDDEIKRLRENLFYFNLNFQF